MICPNCGKDNTGNTKWCCYCGALLEQAETGPVHAETGTASESRSQKAQTNQSPQKMPPNTGRKERRPDPERKPPRRKKRGRVFLWLLAVIALLAVAFAACLVFLPGFSDAVLEKLPLRPADKVQTVNVSASADTAGTDGKQLYIHQSDPGHIVKDEGTGGSYVNNELLLSFENAVTAEEVLTAVAPYGGSIVGINDYLYSYQIQFDQNYTLDKLNMISEEIESLFPSAEVIPNYVIKVEPDAYTPNDREWLNEWGAAPGGKNWGVEAINAPAMWEYCAPLDKQTVNIGVLDNQFFTEHEDLSFTEVFQNSFDPAVDRANHGTHVSGTIAATFNNELGITGISRYHNLFGVSYLGLENYNKNSETGTLPVSAIEAGLTWLIAGQRCRAINISLNIMMDEPTDTDYRSARHLEKQLRTLINCGYDFLIVKAAGNDRLEYRHLNWFALMDDPVVLSHILVVGAAELGDCGDGRPYHIWPESNYGAEVDLIAPGSRIYSTAAKTITMFISWVSRFAPSTYENKSGTSMAAPHVTGTAAAIWSVFPELTGPELKDILISSASGNYYYEGAIGAVKTDNTTVYYSMAGEPAYDYSYPMLDAYAAIQKAEELSNAKSSEFSQADDQNWSDAYRTFVLEQNIVYEDYGSALMGDKTFTVGGQQFFKNQFSEPKFSLYDMDRNGIPELIIFNGSPSMAGATDHVSTFTQGQVHYTGKIGFRGCELYAVDDAAYPGLFCSDGNNGVVRTEYYTLQNGVINASELSRPGGSVWMLPFYTVDEIRAMGWEEFVRLALSGQSAAASDPAPQQQAAQPQPAAEQEGTVIPIEPGVQYSANIFLSNFSEQHAFERTGFDADHYDAKQLVGFTYLYCKINRRTALSVENVWQPSLNMESSFYTITLDTINDILSRHFGITLRDDELRLQSWSDQYYYADGKYYAIAADGESYNRLTVVRQIEQLADGNFRLYFDIYRESIYLYQQANGAVDSSYYYLTSAGAEADPNFTREASGVAVVRPYVHDGFPTMQLIRYSIN